MKRANKTYRVFLAGGAAIVLLAGLAYAYQVRIDPVAENLEIATTSAVKKWESSKQSSGNLLNKIFSKSRCEGTGVKTFSFSPMRPQDISIFIPLGQMVKGHVTPIDHQYLYPVGWKSGGREVPIVAPAAGTIVMVNRFPLQQIEGHLAARDGYDIVIEYSCDFYSKLGLLTGLTDDIAKKVGPIERGRQKYVRIPVQAGEQVARVGGQSLDLFTYDTHTPKKQWIVPAHYNDGEGEKKYITDVLLYFSKSVAEQLMAKNPRIVEPRGGRFDYDIDGRLVGTWFIKGGGGYFPGPNVQNYWKSHLAFAYNELDPSSVEVSIGSWNGDDTGHQFAVLGNGPDPKKVSVESGAIKYELVFPMFTAVGGEPWDQVSYAGPIKRTAGKNTSGVLLVQIVSDREIKVEAFPGKTRDQVTGFTQAARLYER